MKLLFVCHGNICRSTAAEMIMRKMLEDLGLEKSFRVSSAATSTEEIGNDIYPPMKRTLVRHGIPCLPHQARRMTRRDYDENDLLIGMDDENLWNMCAYYDNDPKKKIHLLMEYAGYPGREVSDPWYTRDFEQAYQDIWEGCNGLLKHLRKQEF